MLIKTCTYPSNGHVYGTPGHLDFRSAKGCAASPTGDAGRIVLNSPRGGTPLDTGSMRNASFAARARSPSHSYSGNFSTSFGAAGEALSLSASERARPTKGVSPSPNMRDTRTHKHDLDADVKPSANPSMRFSTTVPTHSMGSMEAAARQYGMSGHRKHDGESSSPPRLAVPPSGSPASSVDAEGDYKDVHGSYQSNQLLHKCESCSKVYRHPSCLVKHRWVRVETNHRSTPCTGRRRPSS